MRWFEFLLHLAETDEESFREWMDILRKEEQP